MFCPSCGNKIADNARFCQACGTIVNIGFAEETASKSCGTTKKSNSKILIIVLIVVALGIGLFAFLNLNSANKELMGSWELLSDGYYNGAMYSSLGIHNNEEVIIDDESYSLEINKKEGTIIIDGIENKYTLGDKFLIIGSYDDSIGDYINAIYFNSETMTDEEAEEYKYYYNSFINADADMIRNYLKGYWCSPQNDMYNVEGLDGLGVMVASDFTYNGEKIEYDANIVSMPDSVESYYFNVNRLVCNDINTIMFIPVSDNQAYFYFYNNNTIEKYKKLQ